MLKKRLWNSLRILLRRLKVDKSGKILHLVGPFQEILGKGILMEEVTTN